MPEPIKRSEAIRPLSRDHHHGLLFCWKVRTGMSRNVEFMRIERYKDWFWENHLKQHFEMEETGLFPVLGEDHPLLKQARSEHDRLKSLFEDQTDPENSITLIVDELEKHIRFEERVLFNEIQKLADQQKFKISAGHSGDFQDNWWDAFWMN